MGRGERSDKPTIAASRRAQSLLYGNQLRGQGPQIDTRPSVKELPEAQIVKALADICVELKIAAPSDQAEKGAHHVLVTHPSGQSTLTPVEDEGRHGVQLAYMSGNARQSLLIDEAIDLPAGERDIDGLAQLEELLRRPLKESRVDFIDTRIDGPELLARLDQGQDIRLRSMIFWDEKDNPEAIMNSSLRIVKRALERRVIDFDQHHQLRELLADQPAEEALQLLAGDDIGRQVVADYNQVPARVSLSKRQ